VPFDEANLSPMAHSFYRDNRRVSNRRIKEELRVRLAYPDYKRGLKALLASGVLDQTPRELNRRGIPKRV
jgi:tRNA nucleotidyltransferase/poly(A) polymerase